MKKRFIITVAMNTVDEYEVFAKDRKTARELYLQDKTTLIGGTDKIKIVRITRAKARARVG